MTRSTQIEAWVELAELCRDSDFRSAVRRMAERQAAERSRGDRTGLHHDLTEAVREQVGEALAAASRPTPRRPRPSSTPSPPSTRPPSNAATTVTCAHGS
ncbi:hypothetical protein [Streptomyces sp. NPDC056452]|uniref:hypothetical protein n=1 Tax=Streptomyces sp. NPDC056452 TaxID=3345821 RepID=UPI0036C7C9A1